jgi:uncharacterized repeat protein (TIGR01451 family)
LLKETDNESASDCETPRSPVDLRLEPERNRAARGLERRERQDPGNSVLPPINGGTVPRPRADLAITSTGRREGTRITFDLTVRNFGPLAAQTVVVENRLPGQVRGISVVPSKGSCAPRNRLLVCQLGTLARNEVVTIQIVSELQQLRSRSVRNIATVGSATRDLNRRNNRTVTVVTLR